MSSPQADQLSKVQVIMMKFYQSTTVHLSRDSVVHGAVDRNGLANVRVGHLADDHITFLSKDPVALTNLAAQLIACADTIDSKDTVRAESFRENNKPLQLTLPFNGLGVVPALGQEGL